jgi:hypothetical protein
VTGLATGLVTGLGAVVSKTRAKPVAETCQPQKTVVWQLSLP